MSQVYNISTLLSEVLKLIPLDPEDPAAFLGHPGHLDRNVSGIAENKTRQDYKFALLWGEAQLCLPNVCL